MQRDRNANGHDQLEREQVGQGQEPAAPETGGRA
jgi:hypothetical protein